MKLSLHDAWPDEEGHLLGTDRVGTSTRAVAVAVVVVGLEADGYWALPPDTGLSSAFPGSHVEGHVGVVRWSEPCGSGPLLHTVGACTPKLPLCWERIFPLLRARTVRYIK